MYNLLSEKVGLFPEMIYLCRTSPGESPLAVLMNQQQPLTRSAFSKLRLRPNGMNFFL